MNAWDAFDQEFTSQISLLGSLENFFRGQILSEFPELPFDFRIL